MTSDRCKQCGAEIIWAKYREFPHKPAPIDASPILKDGKTYGNIWLVSEGAAGHTYHILEPEVAENARERNFDLRTNHLATCPDRERAAPHDGREKRERSAA
jgi:hypothetical protein